jgi:hypothetical protein
MITVMAIPDTIGATIAAGPITVACTVDGIMIVVGKTIITIVDGRSIIASVLRFTENAGKAHLC